jgi:hypothetical protein
MDAKLLAQWSINIMYTFFLIGHLVRSIYLNKGFSSDTIKMYLVSFLIVIIANLGFGGLLSSEALTGLISGCVGYAIGKKFEDSPSKPKTN